jgi:hypothetical protein
VPFCERALVIDFQHTGNEENNMINKNDLGRSLLCALALVMFLATNGIAGETKNSPKTSKKSKSMKKEAPSDVQMTLETKAIDILKAASSRLAAARTMSFTAVATHEIPSRFGPPLLYSVKGEVSLQRPDKLRVISPGDGRSFEFYYDGKSMMAYAPVENFVAVADAPPTIEGMMVEAKRLAAISFPFADMIASDPYKALGPGLKVAFYIGQSILTGGAITDIVAIGNESAFAQVWIGADDHLPRKVRIVYLDDPLALRYQVEYSDWELDRTIPPGSFESLKASSAPHIAFSRPDLQPLPDPKPKPKLKKGKKAKTK